MSFNLRPIDFRASLLEKPTQLYDCGSSLHISFHPIFFCLFVFFGINLFLGLKLKYISQFLCYTVNSCE